MSLYGNYLTESAMDFELSDALRVEILNDILAESYVDYDNYEIFDEGTNMDITREFANMRKEYATLKKEMKAAIKAGNISEAKSKLESIRKIIKESKDKINDLPEDTSTNVIGAILGFLLFAAEQLIPGMCIMLPGNITTMISAKQATKAASKAIDAMYNLDFDAAFNTTATAVTKTAGRTVVGGLLITVGIVVDIVRFIVSVIKEIKQVIKEENKQTANWYKIKMKKYCDDLLKAIDKAEAGLKDAKVK